MNKKMIGVLFVGLFLAAAMSASAQLRNGEAAIFFKSGDVIIDKVIDISSTRLVLETANNGEFPLRDLWMINYVNENWDFPNEREQMETNEHYFFLKSGDVISGKIVDFSSEQIVWELETGEKIAPGRIRRLYFSKRVPAGLQDRDASGGGVTPDGGAMSAVVGTYRGLGDSQNVELVLNDNGEARLTQMNNGRRGVVTSGNWSFLKGDTAIVAVNLGSPGSRTAMTFGRDGNDLVGLNYDKDTYGKLRLRKR
jgi:exosome complex RNA-binding protein Rrp4